MNDITSYLILFNIAKKANLGNLMRTANAFGVSEILIVGKKKYREFGAFGTSRHTLKRHFFRLEDACEYLRQLECVICGVEILDEAVPIQSSPFRGPTAFMVGNEGAGLTVEQCKLCDQFVYIPQYGSGASVNVNVATGIVLHQFAVWAGYSESIRRNGKFVCPEHQRDAAYDMTVDSP